MAYDADRSIASVLQDIVANIQQIVKSEVRLAKAEATEEIGKAGKASKSLAAGAALALYALGFLLLCCMYLLAMVVPSWVAALIVAVVVGAIAVFLVLGGIKEFKRVHAPEQTIASVKENVEWAKAQTK
ncbi:MAG: phage holin family protein [Acidobacteriota bacterium]|nr:phage holin family protein [Acidobacteriota bacterium]